MIKNKASFTHERKHSLERKESAMKEAELETGFKCELITADSFILGDSF